MTDDGVREHHGVSSVSSLTGNVRIWETEQNVTVRIWNCTGSGVEQAITPASARFLAAQLIRLADRVDQRQGKEVHVIAVLGAAGGRARANNLSPERRSEIARKAAAVRWNKRINS